MTSSATALEASTHLSYAIALTQSAVAFRGT